VFKHDSCRGLHLCYYIVRVLALCWPPMLLYSKSVSPMEGTIFRFSMAFQHSLFYLKLPIKPLICGDY